MAGKRKERPVAAPQNQTRNRAPTTTASIVYKTPIPVCLPASNNGVCSIVLINNVFLPAMPLSFPPPLKYSTSLSSSGSSTSFSLSSLGDSSFHSTSPLQPCRGWGRSPRPLVPPAAGAGAWLRRGVLPLSPRAAAGEARGSI